MCFTLFTCLFICYPIEIRLMAVIYGLEKGEFASEDGDNHWRNNDERNPNEVREEAHFPIRNASPFDRRTIHHDTHVAI